MAKAGKRRITRILLMLVLLFAGLWLCGCALIYFEMLGPPEAFGRFMTNIPAAIAFQVLPFETLWTRARSGRIQIGDTAPDFSLRTIDKSQSLQLSALTRQTPVVLIFGSYT